MKIRRILGFVILAAVLALPPASWGLAPGDAAGEYPFNLADVVGRSVSNIAPVRGRIDVAVSSAFEANPQVAICASNQYLVVYEYAGDTGPDSVYGQRLTSRGALLGPPFEIDLQEDKDAVKPDVACEWSTDRFVVVWAYDYVGNDSDHDVYARSVFGSHQASGPQLASGLLPVSIDLNYETNPAIACNSDDASCLVVFGYRAAGVADIYGRRLAVTGPGIGHDGDRFVISQEPAIIDRLPDVSWDPLSENYLAAWEHNYSGSYRIRYSLVHDTDQGNDPELQAGPYFLIDPSSWTDNQQAAAVAFNRRGGTSGRYLVVFKNTNTAIGARRVKGSDGLVEGDPFLVTQMLSSGMVPAVAASGGPGEVVGGADQFLVTYAVDSDTGAADLLYGQAVKGTHAQFGGQLDGQAFEIARTVHSTEDAEVRLGGVAGSAHNGRYAVVWRDSDDVSIDDVYGQLLAPYGVYLPVVLSRR